MPKFKKIEDYGVVGNLGTVALIGKDGSIDWLCLPYMDSPGVFAALLDPEKGGCFKIAPTEYFESHQNYVGNTNVLNTTFDTRSGSAIITDFMPPVDREEAESGRRLLYRKITCIRGHITLEAFFEPVFQFGLAPADLSPTGHGVRANHGSESLYLQTPLKPSIDEKSARCTLTMRGGDVYWFVLSHGGEVQETPEDCDSALQKVICFWADWLHESSISRPVLKGPWHDLVMRSVLVLKLLANQRTGAVIAAPTTSLPESIGGVRNWDYRYSWLRDASFTIQAFEQLGYLDEALGFFHWLKNVSLADALDRGTGNIRIAYTFEGKDIPPEKQLTHLSGYMGSKPVRIGNAAFVQNQLDVFGEIVNTFYMAQRFQRGLVEEYWHFIRSIAEHVCDNWQQKDSGIWEFRTEPRHFTHSKLMCWVALDRAIEMARQHNLDGSHLKWERTRHDIRKAILERGFNEKLNSFVQSFDGAALDATGLLIPTLNFLPPDDPRVTGTMDAITKGLSVNGLIRRYDADDGLPGQEGVFVMCSFWLVHALTLAGRTEQAQQEFLKVLQYRSPLGLFSEEIDPETGTQLGNYPQALSHIGLINAALYLGKRQEREIPGPELMGDRPSKSAV